MATVRIKRFKVWTVAKWVTIWASFIGFFLGLIYAAVMLKYGDVTRSVAVTYVISTPLLNALSGLVGSVVLGSLYNFMNDRIGAVTLEVEIDDVPNSIPQMSREE